MKKTIASLLFTLSALTAGSVAFATPATPVGAPATPAPETPWLYIVGGVLVAGAGVLLYRTSKNKAPPVKPVRPAAPAPVVHANFDASDFLRQAKASFIRLQAAWDKADINDLSKFTTPAILAELQAQIGGRGPHAQATEVIDIKAELLGVEPINTDYVASVQFSGNIKPAGAPAAEPFIEVWNMTRAIDATTGWKLSGIKQLS